MQLNDLEMWMCNEKSPNSKLEPHPLIYCEGGDVDFCMLDAKVANDLKG